MAYHSLILNRNQWIPPTTTATTTTIPPLPLLPPFLQRYFRTMEGLELLQKYTKLIHDCYNYSNIVHSKLVPGQFFDVNGPWCSVIFDGYACWNSAPPGTIVTRNCPSLIVGFNTNLSVYKQCSTNGTWLSQNGSNMAWTDYKSCVDVDDLEFRTTVNKIYVIGYSVSLVALLIALIVFMTFRSLQSTRFRIHIRLFASLALNNICWLLWYNTVVNKVDVVSNNKSWCQILHVLVNYFMVSTYFWMFCEALYLHLAIVVVFIKEKVVLGLMKCIGWGVPFLIGGTYAIVRYIEGTTERCWIEASETIWIITVPVLISLLTSFGFLVNTIRILLTKLRPSPPIRSRRFQAAKKAVRAAAILIPLFGLHFLLMPMRPSPGSSFERIYEIASATIISLQGVCVSILYCFTNHEITTVAKTYWARFRNRNRRTDNIPMTGITAGETMNYSKKNDMRLDSSS